MSLSKEVNPSLQPARHRLISTCSLALSLAVLSLGQPGRTQAQATGDWAQQNIYQVITDRFYDGDPSNNNIDGNYDPAGHRGNSVHGGDFKGIETKLDYIRSLGATAIWISPVVLNADGEFHGYAAKDFYRVDPHWGSLADLKHLVDTAHAKGLRVIDDIVVNHGGNLVDSGDPGYPDFVYPPDGYHLRFRDPAKQYPPPFDLNARNPALTNLFHNQGYIQDYHDDTQVQLGELSGLDDFRTESPYIREQMEKIYEFWIQEVGFDAFRIDTVKHVEMGFWQTWCPAVRDFAVSHGKPDFFMFGEVLDHSEPKCGSYTGRVGGGPYKLDSVLDYPLYFDMRSVFASATNSARSLVKHEAALSKDYDPAARDLMVRFLDNHDQPRFLSLPGATTNRLKVSLTYLYTSQGIPCLYYGTEQGFNGARDPWDREDMFAGQFEWGPSLGDNFDETHPLFQLVAKLNNLRRLYPALRSDKLSDAYCSPHGPGILAYFRGLGSDQMLVVLNTSASPQTLLPINSGFTGGTHLVNLLEPGQTLTIDQNGKTIPLILPGTCAAIFAPHALTLDPVITRLSPPHDTHNVSPSAPILIQFSQPMDRNSVEQAFTTSPTAKGTFSWDNSSEAVTFIPKSPGFPLQSKVSIKIGATAHTAESATPLYANFESLFDTGNVDGTNAPTNPSPRPDSSL